MMKWAIPLVALVVLACCNDDEQTCYRGEYGACPCAEGRSGLAACLDSENGYGACDCSGAVPGLEGGTSEQDAGGGHDAGGKLPFMQACDLDEQCETGLCFPFNAKGSHCTKTCKNDGECPLPSPGCGNRGVCKPR